MARKQPNGAGTVFQEIGRSWCSEAYLELPNGRRKRVRGRGGTPEQAIRNRLAAEDRLRNANPAADRMTVRQLAEQWIDSAHASKWASETRRSYRTALDLHILPVLGAAKVARVTALDVQHVLDRIIRASSGEHVSVANRCRRVMHAMFGRATEWGLIPVNPVASVRSIRLPQQERAGWTRAEASAFLEAASASPYRDLFHAAIVTGLRIGELLGLRWSDVAHQSFTVERTYSQSAPGRVQDHPKSARSRRSVPVPAELAERLEARRGAPDALVFPSRTGNLLNPSNVRRAVRRIAKRAGVPIIKVHDLRRTYASLLAEQMYHPSVIQRLLGHASPDLALRVYTRVHDATTANAVVSLNGAGDQDAYRGNRDHARKTA